MKGVQYFFDNKGNPQAVLIDLKQNAALWEDIQDILAARQRRSEPRIPWEQVKAKLRKAGKTT
jgi:hypothetical protein